MRGQVVAVAILASFSLTGCSAFVPSWNAQPTPIEIDNETDSQDVNESPQEQRDLEPPEPQENQQQPEPEPEPEPDESKPVELESANVEIVMAKVYESEGQIEVIAQVLDVVEDTGECSLKFLAGDFSTERTVKAARSSNYTQCAPIDIPLSELPGGEAVVTVSYLSERYEGESNPALVVIP